MITQQSGVWGISIYFDPSDDVSFAPGSMTNWWEARFTFDLTPRPPSPSPSSMPSPSPSSKPSPSSSSKPSPFPTSIPTVCADSVLTVRGRGCKWVAGDAVGRCPLCSGGICAAVYCPVTCGTCP